MFKAAVNTKLFTHK